MTRRLSGPKIVDRADHIGTSAEPVDVVWQKNAAARYELDQSVLDALCAQRDWSGTEVFLSNEYYGIAATLKRYASYPQGRPVKAVVPHGIYFNDHLLADFERDAGLPAAFVYPAYRHGLYAAGGQMVELAAAAPFVYAERLTGHEMLREGTLFFPAHSLPGLTAEMDFESMPEALGALPDAMQPVTVIMYWQDYLSGRHLPFAKRGFRIVSAGHIYEAEFLPRLAYLLKRHKYAASNAIGSHTFYAIEAGCTFRLIDFPYDYSGSEEDFRLKAPSLSPKRKAAVAELKRVFSEETEEITAQQLELSHYYLGLSHALEPSEMHELLHWLDRLDRFGTAYLIRDDGTRFGVAASPSQLVPRAARRFVLRRIPAAIERAVRAVVSGTIRLARAVFPFLRDVRLRRSQR